MSGVWHLDLDLDRSLVFDTPIFQVLALNLDFEGEKKVHVLTWDLGGFGRCLTAVWHLDLDLDLVTGL